MQVLHPQAGFTKIVRKIFRRPLRERRHQDALLPFGMSANLFHQVINLIAKRTHLNGRVYQSCWPYELKNGFRRHLSFIRTRRGSRKNDGPDGLEELIETQRAIIFRRRQPEAVIHERLLARLIPVVHGFQLRNGGVGLVNNGQERVWEIVNQRSGRRALPAPAEVARVVLNSRTIAKFLHHLDIEQRALSDPLGLNQFSMFLKPLHARFHLFANSSNRVLDLAMRHHEMLGR